VSQNNSVLGCLCFCCILHNPYYQKKEYRKEKAKEFDKHTVFFSKNGILVFYNQITYFFLEARVLGLFLSVDGGMAESGYSCACLIYKRAVASCAQLSG
jgi:hypothetical protein